ncbi:conserved hypothetical protein [Frankia canadensis]|uniref:Uncharacterized protein n=1 Tax=Frankia canadensis TaxID=1836972 RepID=A0A2I2KJC6_9ACTN|nr:hypothetical protein [Frankia canadensis]SNQ45779.1 conserved hypothetical protein [Frankia canadensis]SOU53069.1 conserved hypothetical protein [Frankia canadensis]
MLSPYDDLPLHQTIEPIRRVGTSDRNFYDRYYFNLHSCSDEVVLAAGMGFYPNVGVVDGFLAVLVDGVHRVVRASRVLGADRADTSVGPLRIEVVEGLRRLRLTCEPNEWGIDCDLVWTGAIPAHHEPRHTLYRNERVVMDMCRFCQTGTWSGHLTVDGATITVTPGRYWGVRDRSWGVRPVGAPEPPGIDGAAPPPGHFWNWAPIQFADATVLYAVQEDQHGARSFEEALRIDHGLGTSGGAETSAVRHLGVPRHDWTFTPGTRQLSGGRLTFTRPDAEPTTIEVEPLVPMVLSLGTGYGGEAVPQSGAADVRPWRHGMYQGPLAVEGLSWKMSEIPPAALLSSTYDHVSRFTTDTGEVGYGIVNYVIAGPNDRYGFTGFTDPA